MEAIAKYDFKATADDELSFKREDILKVRPGYEEASGPGTAAGFWLAARNPARPLCFPINYQSKTQLQW